MSVARGTPARSRAGAPDDRSGVGAAASTGRAVPPALAFLVFCVGTATLGSEIAAARLMAPFFGASTVIWANTIAVVLIALSLGYRLGGRFADRNPTLAALRRLVLVASVLLAIVPFVAHPFLTASARAFDTLSLGAFATSLFGTLALVALPLALLGAVSPWALRLAVARVEDAGRVVGRLYAISTVGSLVGVFLATLVLIPSVGTRRTFLVLAAVAALGAALPAVLPSGTRRRSAAPTDGGEAARGGPGPAEDGGAARGGRGPAEDGETARGGRGGAWWPLLVPAALLAALALPTGTIKTVDGGRVLAERETPYQYARVVLAPDGSRRLELNEGQSIHSIWRRETVLTGAYWDPHLVLPFAGAVTADGPPRRIAVLGTAGGTIPRAYGRYFPRTAVDANDIDGELFDLGREYFGLTPRPGLRTVAEDARPFLRRATGHYDAIFVDAYRQPYIPFYLTTREFFALVAERLAPGGVMIVNVGHPEDSDELERVLTATARTAFGSLARLAVNDTNTLLVASREPLGAGRIRAAALDGEIPGDLRPLALQSARDLRPPLTGGRVYTDDRAPVEWLIDSSILSYAAEETR